MGRKKLKKGENVVTLRNYVKAKYADRIKAVIKNVVEKEIIKIQLEELSKPRTVKLSDYIKDAD